MRERDRDETGAARDGETAGRDAPRQQGHGREWEHEVEAAETDGRGTGGVGQDAGGYEPLPEPD
jgi:hypothetical protein